MWMILWAVACGPQPDPELVAQRHALDFWQRAQSAIDEHRPGDALDLLKQARQLRPHDALLVAYSAQALAEEGRLDDAVMEAERGLRLDPDLWQLEYNRAAWIARSGDQLTAARAVAQLLDDGRVTAEQIRQDPDFADGLKGPFFAFARVEPLTVHVGDLPQSAFLGSQVDLDLVVSSIDGPAVLGSPAEGPVSLVSVTEDVAEVRTIRLTWLVVGPGDVLLGPLSVGVGGQTASAAPVGFVALAPADAVQQEHSDVVVMSPSTLQEWMPDSGARWTGDVLWVRTGPGQRAVGPKGDAVVFELRDHGVAVGRWHRFGDLPAAPESVSIKAGPEQVWIGAPVASTPPGL